MNVMWFRDDLRIEDNFALQQAITSASSTVALYIHCPNQWQKQAIGPNRQLFHLRHLQALFQNLAAFNIEGLFRVVDDFSKVPDLIVEMAKSMDAASVICNRQWGHWEQDRDSATRLALQRNDVDFKSFDDDCILEPAKIAQSNGDPYKVFTPFKRTWYQQLDLNHLPVFATIDVCERVNLPDTVQTEQVKLTSIIEDLSSQVKTSVQDAWPIGQKAAFKALDNFINDELSNYHDKRDYPELLGTSQISPYLASGVLAPRTVFKKAADASRSGQKGRETWLSELVWRDFYRHIMNNFPHVSKDQPFNLEYQGLTWSSNQSHFESWQQGQTGVPLVDAGMRQLLQTGWMHNRVRMVVAMFLTKNLFLDWRLGEAHFMQHLVDGDFPSNNGGWQWSASIGTDAAPYFRVFNPFTQAERFDPDCTYIKKYIPELNSVEKKIILKADKHQSELEQAGYATCIVDVKASRKAAIDAFKLYKEKV